VEKLECPMIGEELDDFGQGGLHEEINKYVCGGVCPKSISCNTEDGKPECEGLALMGIVENQVGREGILLMKGLVTMWGEPEEEKI